MLRAPDALLSALASPLKAGHGASCPYMFDCEASEERSSDDHYDFRRQSVKIATAGSRFLGPVIPSSAACRAPSRSVCAPWVPAFLAATYFQPCDRHRHHKKNECTFFCITCGAKPISVCQHCMGAHSGHQVIQVRRYVYCDVVRTCDITSYVDTTGVQNYIINSAKVMFLNHRPHTKIGRANGVDVCRTCQRHLREGYSYCSLACKVEALTNGDAPASSSAAATGPMTNVSRTSAAPCRTNGSGLQKAASDAATLCISPRARSLSGAACVVPSLPAGATAAASPSPRGDIRASGGLTAAAAVALLSTDVGGGGVAAGSCAAAGVLSSDPESSEPGDDTILYGTSRRVVDDGMAATAARRRSAFVRDIRDPYGSASYGSASSEDDCVDYNFENPPKRRRSSLIGRRPSHSSSMHEPQPPSADDLAAAAAAAATLLLPFRSMSGSLPLGVGPASASAIATGPVSPVPESAAAEADLPGAPSLAAAVAGTTAVHVVPGSRRKQNAPQRAPSC